MIHMIVSAGCSNENEVFSKFWDLNKRECIYNKINFCRSEYNIYSRMLLVKEGADVAEWSSLV
jgi:hypothetical protein